MNLCTGVKPALVVVDDMGGLADKVTSARSQQFRCYSNVDEDGPPSVVPFIVRVTAPSPPEKKAKEELNERRAQRVLRKNQREEKRKTKAQRIKGQHTVDTKMRFKLAAKGIMAQTKVAKNTAKMAHVAEAAAIAKYERLFGKASLSTLYDHNDDAPDASSSDGGGSTESSDFDINR